MPPLVGPAHPAAEGDPVLQQGKLRGVEVGGGQVGLVCGTDSCDAVHPGEVGQGRVGPDDVLAFHFLVPRLSHDPSSRAEDTIVLVVTD